tara:strand:- start:8 stop:826 length:819 start_codon:yes stop_codon:yes gene_type:complete
MAITTDAKSGVHPETMMRSEADFAQGDTSSISPDSAQMVIRRASLQIVVKNVQETVKRIEDAAALLGGVVVSSNTSDNEASGISGNLQIRIPSEHLTTLIDAIKFDSIRVPHESINSSDVTEEYIDLTARLENLELTESQLSKLMEKANTIEDILRVQRELTTIRGQIESLAGRVKYLETNVAMSTVQVAIYPEDSGKPITDPDWSINTTIKNALRGLTDIGQFAMEVLIWGGILLPVWGTVAALIVISQRTIKKRRLRRQITIENSDSTEN